MIVRRRRETAPNMLTILIIRTGATEYESQGRIQGTLDVPLSEDGRLRVQDTANELLDASASICALYVGPGRSAQQTADILADKLDLRSKTLKNLRNLDQGLWQGMLVEDVRTKQPRVYRKWSDQPDAVCPPEGETLQDARKRLRAVIDKLQKKHKSGSVAVVLPPPMANLLRGMLLDSAVTQLWKLDGVGDRLWEPIAIPAT